MFMVLKEDIQNLIFKCEKVIEANEIKLKRLKKEEKMLTKVLKDYEVSEDNSIVYNEITTRYEAVIRELKEIKEQGKEVNKVIKKIRPLISTTDVIDDDDYEKEIEELDELEFNYIASEIGQLD